MMPQVTVIIPLYNKERTVARAIGSVQAQEFTDFEVIVVDDGSSDQGPQFVQDLGDPRFRLVHQPNAGPGSARNHGGRLARGDLLAFLDADDEWRAEYLATMVATLVSDKKVAAATSGYVEYPSGESCEPLWRSRGLVKEVIAISKDTDLRRILFLLRFIHPCATVIRTSIFRSLGGFYDKSCALYGEDTHLWIKLLFTEPVAIDLTPLMGFHREDSDLSGQTEGPRPIEPFLADPSDLFDVCPADLADLLSRVLEARANKTACMLGFWGDWRQARTVRRRFWKGGWRSPLALPALLAGTPIAPIAGRSWQRVAGTPRARGY